MNPFKRMIAGLGAQTAPFGFTANDPNAAYRAGWGVIGDMGANMLANNQPGVDPFANLGASLQQAKADSTTRNKEQYTAQRLMEEAAAKRQEREAEAQRQKMIEDQISQLPPELQGLARIAPDKVFGSMVDARFAKGEQPKRYSVGGALVDADGNVIYQGQSNAPVVNINNGGIPDQKLREDLDKAEGKLWSEYKAAGAVSGANAQDFAVLEELLTIAPQGPITGRLAAAFPGVSSAGDAVQSIVKRIAPTLRAPGSGSTSDIEYQGMLQSLPALVNQPEANAMILSVMKAKADVNVQRADIITQYQTGEIDAATARREIAKLDRVSIMTPQMRRALLGISGDTKGKTSFGGPSSVAPEGWEQQDWDYLTEDEKQRVLGE
jgi:hypothetical protein